MSNSLIDFFIYIFNLSDYNFISLNSIIIIFINLILIIISINLFFYSINKITNFFKKSNKIYIIFSYTNFIINIINNHIKYYPINKKILNLPTFCNFIQFNNKYQTYF